MERAPKKYFTGKGPFSSLSPKPRGRYLDDFSWGVLNYDKIATGEIKLNDINTMEDQDMDVRVQEKDVEIEYTNWKGNTSVRKIRPLNMWFGSTEYHPEEQWLIEAWDYGKKDKRTFAIKDIHNWKPIEHERDN